MKRKEKRNETRKQSQKQQKQQQQQNKKKKRKSRRRNETKQESKAKTKTKQKKLERKAKGAYNQIITFPEDQQSRQLCPSNGQSIPCTTGRGSSRRRISHFLVASYEAEPCALHPEWILPCRKIEDGPASREHR
jgi:hypothetical protein